MYRRCMVPAVQSCFSGQSYVRCYRYRTTRVHEKIDTMGTPCACTYYVPYYYTPAWYYRYVRFYGTVRWPLPWYNYVRTVSVSGPHAARDYYLWDSSSHDSIEWIVFTQDTERQIIISAQIQCNTLFVSVILLAYELWELLSKGLHRLPPQATYPIYPLLGSVNSTFEP